MGKHEAPAKEFYERSDGRQESSCKSCHRAYRKRHYTKNKTAYIEKAVRHRNKMRLWVISLKEGKPCTRCGGLFPHQVLHFHHRNPSEKSFDVANGYRRYSRARILAEVAKCDLLCANCHVLTHLEMKPS
jgi:hypothetical protein